MSVSQASAHLNPDRTLQPKNDEVPQQVNIHCVCHKLSASTSAEFFSNKQK